MRISDLPAVLMCSSYGNSFSDLHTHTERHTEELRNRGTEKDIERQRQRYKDRQRGERERIEKWLPMTIGVYMKYKISISSISKLYIKS